MESFFAIPLFIGTGATVMGGLILYYGFGIGKDKTYTKERENTVPIHITPEKIYSEIDERPELQKNAVAKNYKGLHVEWNLFLAYASSYSKGKIFLSLTSQKQGIRPHVTLTVNEKR